MFLALRDLRFATGRFALMGCVVALISLLLVMLSGLTGGLAHQNTAALDSFDKTGRPFGQQTADEDAGFFYAVARA